MSSLGIFISTGQIYSVNDARYFDWPLGLRRYIDDIRQGKGQYPKKYSARYICSLVADLHRTILYGGIAMNPRSHLRLLYEANPLSFLVEQAGGKGSDGKRRILDIEPKKLHERLPLFLGSPKDILELESYGDVQQIVNPGYEVWVWWGGSCPPSPHSCEILNLLAYHVTLQNPAKCFLMYIRIWYRPLSGGLLSYIVLCPLGSLQSFSVEQAQMCQKFIFCNTQVLLNFYSF